MDIRPKVINLLNLNIKDLIKTISSVLHVSLKCRINTLIRFSLKQIWKVIKFTIGCLFEAFFFFYSHISSRSIQWYRYIVMDVPVDHRCIVVTLSSKCCKLNLLQYPYHCIDIEKIHETKKKLVLNGLPNVKLLIFNIKKQSKKGWSVMVHDFHIIWYLLDNSWKITQNKKKTISTDNFIRSYEILKFVSFVQIYISNSDCVYEFYRRLKRKNTKLNISFVLNPENLELIFLNLKL